MRAFELETIAVYWENRIKTYGFQVEHDLSLFQISTSPPALGELGSAFLNDPGDIRFRWVLVQQSGGHTVKVYILLAQQWKEAMQAILTDYRKSAGGLDLRTESPVGMIFFHGPHFGDRFGIADTAVGTLRGKGLPIIAAGCTGASIYIILPQHRTAEARDILTGVFDTP